LELTELVMLRGMRWCAALDRRREVTCRAARSHMLITTQSRHLRSSDNLSLSLLLHVDNHLLST